MRDPFRIEGPAVISFSGGRTSALMLYRVLESYGWHLPDDVKVAFANTGKEMPETLAFVLECQKRWGVDIAWLEFQAHDDPQKRWHRVGPKSASRKGEPFEALIRQKRYLPNPVTRFCTTDMKIRPMRLWAQQELGWDAWTVAVGLRADEQRRVAKLSIPNREAFDRIAPLAEAGVVKADVSAFWRKQPFDLALPNDNGTTPLGNCDLCYLKGYTRITSILRERPELGRWWARMEQEVAEGFGATGQGGVFRKDRPSYTVMLKQVRDQSVLPMGDEPLGDCFCVE